MARASSNSNDTLVKTTVAGSSMPYADSRYENYLVKCEQQTKLELKAFHSASTWHSWNQLYDALMFDRRTALAAIRHAERDRRDILWHGGFDFDRNSEDLDPLLWRGRLEPRRELGGQAIGVELRFPNNYPRTPPRIYLTDSAHLPPLPMDQDQKRQLKFPLLSAQWSDGEEITQMLDSLTSILSAPSSTVGGEEGLISAEASTSHAAGHRPFYLRSYCEAFAMLSHGLATEGFVIDPSAPLRAVLHYSFPLPTRPSRRKHKGEGGVSSLEEIIEQCRSVVRLFAERTDVLFFPKAASLRWRRRGADGASADGDGQQSVRREPTHLVVSISGCSSPAFHLRHPPKVYSLGPLHLSDFFGHFNTAMWPRASASETTVGYQQCQICTEDFEESGTAQYWRLLNCGHPYCLDSSDTSCLLHMISEARQFPLRCLADGCNEIVQMEDIDAALLSAFDTAQEVDAFLERIVNRSVAHFLRTNTLGYTQCPRDGCNAIVRIQVDAAGVPIVPARASSSALVSCFTCNYQGCVCGYPTHNGLECHEYYQRHVKPNEEFNRMGNYRYCPNPNCSIGPIERNGGCDHMHCKACGTNFCWQCGYFPSTARGCHGKGVPH